MSKGMAASFALFTSGLFAGGTIDHLILATARANKPPPSIGDPRALPGTLLHSIGALAVLLIIAILAIFKPRGMTRYGWRKQYEQSGDPA